MSSTQVRYRDAVAEALRMEMHRDTAVVLLAQDRGPDPNGATRGFAGLFGERFVPLALSGDAIIGAAAGAAAAGLRPVCEIPISEFGARALGELTRVAELCRTERLELPLLVRVPLGGYASSGAADGALDPETWLLGLEEIRVVAPATPGDAKGMTASALRHPAPVCLLEHEALGEVVDTVPEGGHRTPLGEARIVAGGDRLTVIAYGPAVQLATRAATELEGIEVLDLRSLQPLDEVTILASVARTGRVVIVSEAGRSSRIAGEVSALVAERAFQRLHAQPRRAVIPPPDSASLRAGGERPRAVRVIAEACSELIAG